MNCLSRLLLNPGYQHLRDQLPHTAVMGCRNRMDRLNPQPIKIAGSDVLAHSVNFVDHKMKGFILRPQVLHQRFIAGMHSSTTIH